MDLLALQELPTNDSIVTPNLTGHTSWFSISASCTIREN